jgi:hypothetical protein
MLNRLLIAIVLIVSILPPPASATAQAQTWVCLAEAPHAVYLPSISGGISVPKAETLRRIDESVAGQRITDTDVFDASEATSPNVPEGITVTAVQDGILINVDFNIDTAHLHPRFQAFIVYGRPYGTEIDDGTGHEVGRFSDNDWVWQMDTGGYQGWEVALSAISNTGYESAKSAWYRCILSTFYDDFSDYGGSDTNDQEGLFWLKLADFEAGEEWELATGSVGSISDDTAHHVEGDQGKMFSSGLSGGSHYINGKLDVSLNLGDDSRFAGDDDFVFIAAYSDADIANAQLYMQTTPIIDYYYYDITTISAGWNYIAIAKADFTAVNNPDWSNITRIGLQVNNGVTGAFNVTFDNLQIITPDANGDYNPTGGAWMFNAGEWHVIPGFRPGEPFYNFSLAQISNPEDDDYFGTVQNVEMPNNKVSAGLMLTDGGRAGLTFRIADDTLGSEDALAVELDADANTLYLVRYATGVKSTLASTSYTPSMLAWLGVDFRDPDNEGRVKVYAANTQWDLFTASALKISHTTTAPWPDGKQVGVVTHAVPVRFVEFRAGSPQTADYAHKAGHALTAGYSVEDYGAAVARRVALPATIGVWSMASVQRSTGNVYDSSGQGRTLSYHGNLTFDWRDNGTPYINLDGTGDYFSRSSETDLNIVGTESVVVIAKRGLTLIGWFYVGSTDNATLMGKANDTDGPYFLYSQAGTAPLFRVRNSGDTTNYSVAGASTVGAWHFVAGVYVPGDRLALRVNDTTTENTTSIPASILSAGDNFAIGGDGAGGTLFTGYVGLCSLHFCAMDDEMVERVYQGEKALYGVA